MLPVVVGAVVGVVAVGFLASPGGDDELSVEEYEYLQAVERANNTLAADLVPAAEVVGAVDGPVLGHETGLYVFTSGARGGQRIDLDTGEVARVDGLEHPIVGVIDGWLVLAERVGYDSSGTLFRVPVGDPGAAPGPIGVEGVSGSSFAGANWVDVQLVGLDRSRGSMFVNLYSERVGATLEIRIADGALVGALPPDYWSSFGVGPIRSRADGTVHVQQGDGANPILHGWSTRWWLFDGTFLASRCPEPGADCEIAWFDQSGDRVDRAVPPEVKALVSPAPSAQATLPPGRSGAGPVAVTEISANSGLGRSFIDLVSGHPVDLGATTDSTPLSSASPDGRYLATGNTSTIFVLDRETGRSVELPRIDGLSSWSVAIVAKNTVFDQLVNGFDPGPSPDLITLEELSSRDGLSSWSPWVAEAIDDLAAGLEASATIDPVPPDIDFNLLVIDDGVRIIDPVADTIAEVDVFATGRSQHLLTVVDGSPAFVARDPNNGGVVVVDVANPTEPEVREIEVVEDGWVVSAHPAGPDRVTLTVFVDPYELSHVEQLVDTTTGLVVETVEFAPTSPRFWDRGLGGLATADGGYIYDPSTGEVVLQGWEPLAGSPDRFLASRCPISLDDCELAWFGSDGERLDLPVPDHRTDLPYVSVDLTGRVLMWLDFDGEGEAWIALLDLDQDRLVGHLTGAFGGPASGLSSGVHGRWVVVTEPNPTGDLVDLHLFDLDTGRSHVVAEDLLAGRGGTLQVGFITRPDTGR